MAPEESRYAVALTELENSVRVPLESQRTVQAEPPPEEPISQQERERLFLLGVGGAG